MAFLISHIRKEAFELSPQKEPWVTLEENQHSVVLYRDGVEQKPEEKTNG